ncbi:Ras guanine nucleotide exchange factor [Pelomyxa schiedti]|nr:Ras guanine nucleotide exchange factor [Pelomyxa schiedti]
MSGAPNNSAALQRTRALSPSQSSPSLLSSLVPVAAQPGRATPEGPGASPGTGTSTGAGAGLKALPPPSHPAPHPAATAAAAAAAKFRISRGASLQESVVPLAKELVLASQRLARAVTSEDRSTDETVIISLAKEAALQVRSIEELVTYYTNKPGTSMSHLKELVNSLQESVLGLISSVKAAFINPYDMQASQDVAASCKSIAHDLITSISALEAAPHPQPIQASLALGKSISQPSLLSTVKPAKSEWTILAQETAKSFSLVKTAISEQNEPNFIEGVKQIVQEFNKYIAFSHVHKSNHEQRLRNNAVMIGQLAKSAFRFPRDPVYQKEFYSGVENSLVTLIDLMASAHAASNIETNEAVEILTSTKQLFAPEPVPDSHILQKSVSSGSLAQPNKKEPLPISKQIISLLTKTFPGFQREWESTSPSISENVLASIEKLVSVEKQNSQKKGIGGISFLKKYSSKKQSPTPAVKRGVDEVLQMQSLVPDAPIAIPPTPRDVSSITQDSSSLADLTASLSASLVLVLKHSNKILLGQNIERLDFSRAVEELMERISSMLDSVSLSGWKKLPTQISDSGDSSSTVIRTDMFLCQLLSSALQITGNIKSEPPQIEESVITDSLGASPGKDLRKVESVLMNQIYCYSNSLRVLTLQLLGLSRMFITESLNGSPILVSAVVHFVATCQYMMSFCHTLLGHVGTYNYISNRDSGTVSSSVAAALQMVSSEVPTSVSPWQEKVLPVPDSNGTLRAGTLNNIVSYLTSDEFYNTKLLKSCITTYQSFCTPYELLDKLRQRYQIPEGALQPAKATAIQLKVGVVIKYWIENQFQDFDKRTISMLNEFIELLKRDGHTRLATSLQSELAKKEEEAKVQQQLTTKETPIEIPSYSLLEIWESAPEIDIAQQLTLIESSLFQSINASELLDQNWTKKKTRYKSVNVHRMIARSNQVAFWVTLTILSGTTASVRARYYTKFIMIAEHLRRIGNYSSVMSILAGLTTSPVSRLTLTKQAVNKSALALLEKLHQLMSPTMSFKTYRECLHKNTSFVIPYLGTYLSDLTFICDGNPDFVDSTEEVPLINIKKRELEYSVIAEMQLFQVTNCTFTPQEPLYTLLQDLPSCDDDQLYTLSLQLEPRKSSS